MARLIVWKDATRDELRAALPDAVVVLPIGATEQHGPHLPVGTDALVAETIARRAAESAAVVSPHEVILAPTLPFGASAHHLAFGGTISLGTATLIAVLDDIVDSIEQQGGRRVLIVNGHGGNQGASRAVASAADARAAVTVATVDYWEIGGLSSPGHAGEVETSLILAIDPDRVHLDRVTRDGPPDLPAVPGLAVHGKWIWDRIGGFTDDPIGATSERGRERLDRAVEAVARAIVGFARLRVD